MKKILSLIISVGLVVSGYSQTRNVLVGTNNAVVQPTNFWSADAINARSGLGLGNAATNQSSAFQPSSAILSNLSSSNGSGLTNISINGIIGGLSTNGNAIGLTNFPSLLLRTNGNGSGITNISGANVVGVVASASNIAGTIAISNVSSLQSSLDAKLGTNPTLFIANISNLQTTLDEKLGTNPTLQISNIAALQTALDGKLSGTFPIAISNVSGLQTSLNGKLSTNPTLSISNISGLQTNLDSKLSITGNAANLTNFPASLLRTTGDASGLTNFPTLNQNTTGTASNVTGVVAIANGGTGTNSVIGARANLGLSWIGLTNTNAETFRTALELGPLSTLSSIAISNVTGLQTSLDAKLASNGNAINLTNFPTVALASNITGTAALATNVTGVVALVNGGTGATNAAGARTALGVGSSDVFVGLTNLGSGGNLGFSSSPYILGSTNSTSPNNAVSALGASTVRDLIGALTTNGNGAGLTNLTASKITGTVALASNVTGTVALASNVTGTIAISNGGTGATNTATARTNLGLGATWLTNTNVTNFRTAIELGAANNVLFGEGTESNVGIGVGTNNTGLAYGGGIIQGRLGLVEGGNIVAVLDGQANPFFGLYLPLTFQGGNATSNAATTRTNLGLGWSALTNSNAGTSLVSVNTNGEVVSPTNFWQVAPIQTLVQDLTLIGGTQTNNATNARNLYVYSLNTNLVSVSNVIVLPTNAATFAGDELTVIHMGTTNTTTVVRQAGSANNLITLSRFDESVKFIRESGQWDFYHNISFVEPIQFSGTNASNNIAATRTNLGLGATWLTNTNVTNFRTAIELGTTNSVVFSNIASSGTLTSTGVVTTVTNLNVGGSIAVTNAAVTRTNLGLGATWLTNTNVTNFRSAIGLGANDTINFGNVNALQVLVGGTNIAETGVISGGGFYIYDENTNTTAQVFIFEGDAENRLRANARTNLGLPLAALTNTNNANFQAAIFATNAAPTNTATPNTVNFTTAIHWMEVNVVTNGVTNNFRIPLFK